MFNKVITILALGATTAMGSFAASATSASMDTTRAMTQQMAMTTMQRVQRHPQAAHRWDADTEKPKFKAAFAQMAADLAVLTTDPMQPGSAAVAAQRAVAIVNANVPDHPALQSASGSLAASASGSYA